jgi:Activator of Hsp90 ATPase homolog 1-like protein
MVTFELFEEGKKTKLRLTHAGIETFDQANSDFAKKNFEGGWTAILDNSLKVYLETINVEA